jgi:hypothetical protein
MPVIYTSERKGFLSKQTKTDKLVSDLPTAHMQLQLQRRLKIEHRQKKQTFNYIIYTTTYQLHDLHAYLVSITQNYNL